jgi:ABC-type phosphate transport system substrate-binding protein
MRMTKWPDGSAIRVFVLGGRNPAHIAFCKEILDVYPYQLQVSWDRLVYSGTGQAPIELDSEQEMLAQVAATPGAIGYLTRRMVNDHVRILPVE